VWVHVPDFSGVVGGMQEERKESNTYLAAQRRRYFEERKGKERNIMHANVQLQLGISFSL